MQPCPPVTQPPTGSSYRSTHHIPIGSAPPGHIPRRVPLSAHSAVRARALLQGQAPAQNVGRASTHRRPGRPRASRARAGTIRSRGRACATAVQPGCMASTSQKTMLTSVVVVVMVAMVAMSAGAARAARAILAVKIAREGQGHFWPARTVPTTASPHSRLPCRPCRLSRRKRR